MKIKKDSIGVRAEKRVTEESLLKLRNLVTSDMFEPLHDFILDRMDMLNAELIIEKDLSKIDRLDELSILFSSLKNLLHEPQPDDSSEL